MKDNLHKNYFWFIKSLETYALAVYFIILHSRGTFTPPGHILEYLDDPPFILILTVTGTVGMVYALWDIKYMLYKPLMTGLLTFVWMIFLCSFGFRDLVTGNLSLQVIYAFFVVFSIVGQLVIKRG